MSNPLDSVTKWAAALDGKAMHSLFQVAAAVEKPHVAVLVPTHRGTHPLTRQALEKMIAATRDAHVTLDTMEFSIVHQTRNQLLASLFSQRRNSRFTHALFCDDDMLPPPHALNMLLQQRVDCIGAICTTRPPFMEKAVNARLFYGKETIAPSVLVPKVQKVDRIGMAFILLSRKAIELSAAYSLSQTFHKRYLGMTDAFAQRQEYLAQKRFIKTGNAYWFEYLRDPESGYELGECYSFCTKLQDCGIDIYGDSRFSVGHMGGVDFVDNYGMFNRLDAEKATTDVRVRSIEDFRNGTDSHSVSEELKMHDLALAEELSPTNTVSTPQRKET